MENKRPPVSFTFESPPHVLVIEERYYPEVADMQLAGAKAVLDSVKATYEVVTVPGALEIPAAVAYALKALDFDPLRKRADGYIVLGCIIKGETMHADILGHESARAINEIAAQHSLAIGNGILTCNTMEQALERADASKRNRGGSAAESALRMIELKHHFRLSPKRRWVAK